LSEELNMMLSKETKSFESNFNTDDEDDTDEVKVSNLNDDDELPF
jgi:hypothetical protein